MIMSIRIPPSGCGVCHFWVSGISLQRLEKMKCWTWAQGRGCQIWEPMGQSRYGRYGRYDERRIQQVLLDLCMTCVKMSYQDLPCPKINELKSTGFPVTDMTEQEIHRPRRDSVMKKLQSRSWVVTRGFNPCWSLFLAVISCQFINAGWWFGTCFSLPNWLIFFRGVSKPPTISIDDP